MLRKVNSPSRQILALVLMVLLSITPTVGRADSKNSSKSKGVPIIEKGVPAPYAGRLLTEQQYQDLIVEAKARDGYKKLLDECESSKSKCVGHRDAYKAGWGMCIASKKRLEDTCRFSNNILTSTCRDATKRSGVAWWVPVVIGIGSLGIGVGVGTYLGK